MLEILEGKERIADLQHKVRSADEVIQSMIHETEVAQNEVNKNSGTPITSGEILVSLFGNCFL